LFKRVEETKDFSELKKKYRLSLSLKFDVRGPSRQYLSRHMAFHRFDHATYSLTATMQWTAHRSKVFVAYRFFAVLIDTHSASMHRD